MMVAFIAIAVLVALMLAASGVVYQRVGAARDARRFAPTGRFVDVRGRRLHLVVRGEGAPTVWFESAIAASSLSWTRVQPSIARFTTACAYDRAGLGWSDPPAAPVTHSTVVDDFHALVAASGRPTPCVMVGHSFGAFVCLAFASKYPQLVCGLVLVDPPTDWIELDRRREYLLRGARQMSRLGAVLASTGVVRACLALLTGGAPAAPKQFVKIFGRSTAHTIERLVGEIRKLPEDVHPLVQAAWCQPKAFRAMADYLRVFEEAVAAAARHAIPRDLPLVVISAGDQPDEVMAAQRRLAESSLRGRHVVARNSGHWVPFDEPDVIVDAIKPLLRPVSRLRQQE